MTDQPEPDAPYPHLRELDALLDDLVAVWDLTDPYELGVVRCLQDVIAAKTTDAPWPASAVSNEEIDHLRRIERSARRSLALGALDGRSNLARLLRGDPTL